VPEYFAVLQQGGEAPKVVVRFRIKQISISLLSIELRIETTDFYLIRARKRAQLAGLDHS
jgi:hypothetical protein